MSAPAGGQLIKDGVFKKLTVTCGGSPVAFAADPILVLQAILQNNSASDISFGPDSSADFYTLNPLSGYSLMVPGKLFDLATFYAHAGGAAVDLTVLYCD